MTSQHKESYVIISARLHTMLAAASVLSLLAHSSLPIASGQTSNSGQPATIADSSHQDASDTAAVSAQRSLLKARQALAHGDVNTATAMLQSAQRFKVDFRSIGDSPETVVAMIGQQNQLAEMAQNQDQSFNSGAASFLLTQAEALIYYRDFETADMLIQQAKKFPVEFTPAIGNPDKLSQMLKTARQSAAPTTDAKKTAVAKSSTKQVDPKAEAMKLLSQAQLAMDQENWKAAQSFVQQAKQLGVPDNQFSANEARPWQLELKIQNALNRHSFDPTVMQTGFAEQLQTQNQTANNAAAKSATSKSAKKPTANVIQADYDPASDNTFNVQVVGATEIASAKPAAKKNFQKLPTSGLDYYNAGLQAVKNGEDAAAVAYFQKAWENRDALEGKTRQAIKDQLTRLVPGSTDQITSSENIMKATLASDESSIDLDKIKTEQREAFRKVQSDVFKERAAAERLLETSPREALEKMSMVRGRVAQSKLDSDSQRPLLAIVDRDISEMQKYIEQNLPDIINREENESRKEDVERRAQRKIDVEQQLQKLVNEYNQLVDEKRFAEAGVIVRQATDLAPKDQVVVMLNERHKVHANYIRATDIKEAKQAGFVDSMAGVDESTIPWDDRNTLLFPSNREEYEKKANRRLDAVNAGQYNSESERRIWNVLKNEQVQGEYRGTLAEAIDQLSRQAGVNIVFDTPALNADGIKKDQLVDVPIRSAISLKSALDVILSNANLVFVVESEVIKVTTKDSQGSKVITKTYYIGDLVVPMGQNPDPLRLNFMQPNMPMQNGNGSYNALGSNRLATGGGTSQVALAQQMGGNVPGNPFGGGGGMPGMSYNGGSNNGPQMGTPTYATVGNEHFGGVTQADFFPLINLIQSTIHNESWLDTGTGLGTIQSYPATLSLIVSQTQEIQDEIQDLLKKLRELNDVQIVIEVRFITLRDSFFERIGVDFDFKINDNTGFSQAQANGTDRLPGTNVVGLDSTGGFTGDLDVGFSQGSFTQSPVFGGTGFSPATAANLGFAILSDIEVFFLIQAAKGDDRSSIMQAPTVTMFNGQSGNVSDGANRPFVTSVIPVVGDFAVAHQPVITILPDGTNLNVQAVVSDDRRFVRLNLVPFFSQVTDVKTFTFDGRTTTERTTNSVLDDLLDAIDPTPGGNNDNAALQTTTQGITIQLPVLSFTTVNTVVSVPDGGTVLMGGIKRMSEGRTERGVPFLSNLPYVNRLFKNTSIGHDTSNLMMMVTPRIIIQKEMEEDQVGKIGG